MFWDVAYVADFEISCDPQLFCCLGKKKTLPLELVNIDIVKCHKMKLTDSLSQSPMSSEGRGSAGTFSPALMLLFPELLEQC